MSGAGPAAAGLSLRLLAYLGLMHPDTTTRWTVDQIEELQAGARTIWAEVDLYCDGPAASVLTRAISAVTSHDPDWWPGAFVLRGVDRATPMDIIDLTLPALWGTEWLQRVTAALPATRARFAAELRLDTLAGIMNDRLEDLRAAAEADRPVEASERVEDAIARAGAALTKLGPVWIFGNPDGSAALAVSPPEWRSHASL
ncbi:hypothetical protein [Acetobacter sp. DsW_063]|uniref:hypothetical protein n=1 Tax=Acetobacter sp. DsW_063 TaxID=1514894 RepID=UPI000A3AEA10|nr:hypothetical protein [Acetobacter sp. DsW_063]OUJ17128.1 hypothetical protein HK28_00050 [Acetobacter sp. DsW_063]